MAPGDQSGAVRAAHADAAEVAADVHLVADHRDRFDVAVDLPHPHAVPNRREVVDRSAQAGHTGIDLATLLRQRQHLPAGMASPRQLGSGHGSNSGQAARALAADRCEEPSQHDPSRLYQHRGDPTVGICSPPRHGACPEDEGGGVRPGVAVCLGERAADIQAVVADGEGTHLTVGVGWVGQQRARTREGGDPEARFPAGSGEPAAGDHHRAGGGQRLDLTADDWMEGQDGVAGRVECGQICHGEGLPRVVGDPRERPADVGHAVYRRDGRDPAVGLPGGRRRAADCRHCGTGCQQGDPDQGNPNCWAEREARGAFYAVS